MVDARSTPDELHVSAQAVIAQLGAARNDDNFDEDSLTPREAVHNPPNPEDDDVTSQSSLGNITLPISDMDERVSLRSVRHATGATTGVQEKNGDDDAAKQQATVRE